MSKNKVEFATEEELKAIAAAPTEDVVLCEIYRATADFGTNIRESFLRFRSGDLITDAFIVRELLNSGAPIALANGAAYTTCPCCKHTYAV